MLIESTSPEKKEVEVLSNWKLDSIGIEIYFQESKDPMLSMVRKHDLKKKLYSISNQPETYRK